MCKVYAICNQKGGCSKTSVTLNLGIGLAMEGKRVALIDADPQGSLTISLGYPDPDELPVTLATIMTNINAVPLRRVHALTLSYAEIKPVAVVDGILFSTVQDAVDYVYHDGAPLTGKVIHMVYDAHENVTIPSGVDTTLNLNGFTLSGLTTAISAYGTLTIEDDHQEVTVTQTPDGAALSKTYAPGAKTGTVTGQAAEAGGGVHVLGGGDVTLRSGQIANCTAIKCMAFRDRENPPWSRCVSKDMPTLHIIARIHLCITPAHILSVFLVVMCKVKCRE